MNDISRTQTATRGTDSALIDSDRVEGTDVFDPRGNHIGSIKRLVIDKLGGRVVYTVAQFGGFLGLGATEYTIPWNMLAYDPSVGGFRTNITEEQLRGAPAFGRDGRQDYDDRAAESALNEYYGSPNYWE